MGGCNTEELILGNVRCEELFGASGLAKMKLMSDEASRSLLPLVQYFNVLETAGLVFALFVLSTVIFSSAIHRPTTWFGLCMSLMFYGLSMLILAIGQIQFGPKPQDDLCLFQAVLIEAGPVWIAWATAAYALQVWQASREYIGNINHHKRMYQFWLLASPATIASLVLAIALGMAFRVKKKFARQDLKVKVARDPAGLFCGIASDKTSIMSLIIGVLGILVASFLTLLLARLLIRRGWLREIDAGINAGVITRWTLARLATLLVLVTVLLALSFSGDDDDGRRSRESSRKDALSLQESAKRVVLATLPFLITMAFGMEMDILRVWMFWHKAKPVQDPEDSDFTMKSVWEGGTTRTISLASPRVLR